MRYCKGCGAQLPDGAAFCPSCGKSVESDGQQQTTPPQNNNNQPVYHYDNYSTISIIGFIFAFLEPIVGLIISIIAYNQAKTECSPRSQSFARSGIIISSVIIGLIVLFVCLVIGVSILDWAYALSLM